MLLNSIIPKSKWYRTGPEVGLAWLSQLCNTKAIKNGSSGQGYTSGTGVSAISNGLTCIYYYCMLTWYIFFSSWWMEGNCSWNWT